MIPGDPPPDGSHGPHVLVDDVVDPHLSEAAGHHLTRVLRLRRGDPLTVGDGAGAWRPCRLGDDPEPVGEVRSVARPSPAIGVAFALIKGGRPELVVQKLTELGVDRIVPMTADRSVVRWDGAKATSHLERLRRVAREAVQQSRRAWLPRVDPLTPFATLVAEPGVAMAERGGGPPTLETPLVLVGPEGGWSDHEREAPVPRVGLAAAVLRAETAAIAAATVLAARRDGVL
jgi:16S rRNA (uracil1498-N3)-methyltransferase